MIEEDYISNNTRFRKSKNIIGNALFIENIVFINSDTLKQNIEALLKEKDINTITLTDDYKLDNLDFLNDYNLNFIKSIDILSDSVTNIEGLYSLTELEVINSENKKIDYSKFLKIRDIGGELSAFSYKTLSDLKSLESINITNKFREDDLTIFKNNRKLKFLTLRGSKITSLIGLEKFIELECLSLFHNRRIVSLEGISEKHNETLKEINIYSAPKLFYVNDFLSKLTDIEILQLEVKKIDSFKFLDSLRNLKSLGIHNLANDVEDKNKTPLINALKRTNGKIW